jgi:hypothetical protein
MDEIAEKYLRELVTLKLNSKPLINSLTMMAEDVMTSAAPLVVQTIEHHLTRVTENRNSNPLPPLASDDGHWALFIGIGLSPAAAGIRNIRRRHTYILRFTLKETSGVG